MILSGSRISTGKAIACILAATGAVIVLFFGLGLAAFMEQWILEGQNQAVAMIICIAFVLLGLWCLSVAIRELRLLSRCRQYASALCLGQVDTVTALAASLRMDSGRVYTDLQQLIRKGYLQNISVDASGNRIVLPAFLTAKGSQENQTGITCICAACGGVTVLRGSRSGICEYCGSKIGEPQSHSGRT